MAGKLLFTTRDIAKHMKDTHPGAVFYDTSSYGEHGVHFSPFTYHEQGIPVPGMPGAFSHSVEGIWQGLKIIDGSCDFSLFSRQRPVKRKFEPYPETRFMLGDAELDIVAARHVIYVPSYTYLFNNIVPGEVIDGIMALAAGDIDQYFFDVDENPNINDPTRSYAHASLLVDLLESELSKRTGR
ncbi:hypothetical protein KY359_04280 [Candidatus Woesearchaeota archaeon]|nr:hypothetical protein [Candidatus Woesearchaeota archaeon]